MESNDTIDSDYMVDSMNEKAKVTQDATIEEEIKDEKIKCRVILTLLIN